MAALATIDTKVATPKSLRDTSRPNEINSVIEFLMDTVLPDMYHRGERYVYWEPIVRDLKAVLPRDYSKLCSTLKRRGFEFEPFNDSWFVDFTSKTGKRVRCHITSSSFSHPTKELPTSPLAFAMGYLFCSGCFVLDCKFSE